MIFSLSPVLGQDTALCLVLTTTTTAAAAADLLVKPAKSFHSIVIITKLGLERRLQSEEKKRKRRE